MPKNALEIVELGDGEDAQQGRLVAVSPVYGVLTRSNPLGQLPYVDVLAGELIELPFLASVRSDGPHFVQFSAREVDLGSIASRVLGPQKQAPEWSARTIVVVP